jgi:hypothetical protein
VPALEVMDLTDKAVLWQVSGKDRYARLTFDAPREINVRWVDRIQLATGADGNTVTTLANVAVAEDVYVGSLLWYGTLAEWATYAGTDGAYVMQVVTINDASDIKGRNVRRELALSRFMDAVPA